MNRLIYILMLGFLFACSSKTGDTSSIEPNIIHDTIFVEKPEKEDLTTSDFYIKERLPGWFLETALLKGLNLKEKYKFDNRLNPLYLEEDFNGDGIFDIAIPIVEINTQKVGFAIIHGKSNEVFIIGAGNEIKNGLSDDLFYIDIWKINREKVNEPGLDKNGEIDKNGPLILENPSVQVEKSEVGGGQIYWNAKEYVYFHQTC